jgi:hypothetical protein
MSAYGPEAEVFECLLLRCFGGISGPEMLDMSFRVLTDGVDKVADDLGEAS